MFSKSSRIQINLQEESICINDRPEINQSTTPARTNHDWRNNSYRILICRIPKPCLCTVIRRAEHVCISCMCLGVCFSLAIQLIYAVPHEPLGTATPKMLLTLSEHSNSSFVRFPQGVFFLLFNQGLDPMRRGLFSCETRTCRPQLTIRILNRVSCSLTNQVRSHNNRIGKK